MAYANWLSVSPTTGSGNGTVSVSTGSEHSGRVARTTTLTITAANVEDQTVTVNQAGKPENVDAPASASAQKTGQTVTITGTSNSTDLTFSLGTGDLSLTLPSAYTANGVTVENGATITGDPGATAEYTWSIQFTVPENTTISERSKQIIVTANGGMSDTCTLTQAAGDAYVVIKKDGSVISSLNLTYQGTAVSFDVESNTSWSIA